jgi:hypothetical protein
MQTIAQQLRNMGWTVEQIGTATIGGKPIADCEPKKASDGWPGFKSKWEATYSQLLADRVKAGELLGWDYEAITFRLTESTIVNGRRTRATTYTPDFDLWLPDGRLHLVEVKGFRRTKDINRYKAAKDKFRAFTFEMVSRKNGQWIALL